MEKIKDNAHACTKPEWQSCSSANAIADSAINLKIIAEKVPKAHLIRYSRARHIWVAREEFCHDVESTDCTNLRANPPCIDELIFAIHAQVVCSQVAVNQHRIVFTEGLRDNKEAKCSIARRLQHP